VLAVAPQGVNLNALYVLCRLFHIPSFHISVFRFHLLAHAFGKCNIMLLQIQVRTVLNILKIVKNVGKSQFVLIFAEKELSLLQVQSGLPVKRSKTYGYDKNLLQK
jgi:hypothetical protein